MRKMSAYSENLCRPAKVISIGGSITPTINPGIELPGAGGDQSDTSFGSQSRRRANNSPCLLEKLLLIVKITAAHTASEPASTARACSSICGKSPGSMLER